MTATFHLEVVTLNKKLYDQKVSSLTVPGADGELTILANHVPLVVLLKAGEILVKDESGQESFLVISRGSLTVQKNKAVVMATSADLVDELNEEKIKQAQEQAEKILREKSFADDRSSADATAALEHAIAQMKTIRRRRRY